MFLGEFEQYGPVTLNATYQNDSFTAEHGVFLLLGDQDSLLKQEHMAGRLSTINTKRSLKERNESDINICAKCRMTCQDFPLFEMDSNSFLTG